MKRDDENRYRIAKLLANLRVGQITEEEMRELEAWRKVCPENEALYLRWQEGDFLPEGFARFKRVDVSRAENAMQKRIHEARRAKVKINVLRYGVAAAVSFLLIGSLYLFDGTGKQEAMPISISLVPSQLPTLKLDDGSTVLLDSTSAEIKEGGVIVAKSGASKLSYLAGKMMGSEKLSYNTLSVPKGAEFDLVLADGTRVWLNADSKLKYPVAFGSEGRDVELEGEGFFKVTKDAKRPFRVKVKGQVVEVLGTEFNVEAYPDEKYVYTTLVQGKVRVDADGKSLELTPGMQSVVGDQKMYTRKVDTDEVVSWMNGMFVLEDRTLEEIMSRLSRWYGFSVFYEDATCKTIPFKGKIPRYASFESILNILERTGEVKFKVSGEVVTVFR